MSFKGGGRQKSETWDRHTYAHRDWERQRERDEAEQFEQKSHCMSRVVAPVGQEFISHQTTVGPSNASKNGIYN